jgi:hypothetical protein
VELERLVYVAAYLIFREPVGKKELREIRN